VFFHFLFSGRILDDFGIGPDIKSLASWQKRWPGWSEKPTFLSLFRSKKWGPLLCIVLFDYRMISWKLMDQKLRLKWHFYHLFFDEKCKNWGTPFLSKNGSKSGQKRVFFFRTGLWSCWSGFLAPFLSSILTIFWHFLGVQKWRKNENKIILWHFEFHHFYLIFI